MKKIKFGIIGLGLMGREFASAAARWCHLPDMEIKPEITAICDKVLPDKTVQWYKEAAPAINQVTGNYREMLANPDVQAVYCAVPHNLHEEIYCEIIKSGKHLMAEKPFGMDLKANSAILACVKKNPGVFVRCSSEFPFYPAAQQICGMIENNEFGIILEVNCGFLHSSDLDFDKPINWKRMVECNGEYGCMGDLGMHVCHIPFRAGWVPKDVRSFLSKVVKERKDAKGNKVPCLTWDNAVMLCSCVDPATGEPFPMTMKTQRIAPGEKDTWYIEVLGTKSSARFSTKYPKTLQFLSSSGRQSWENIDMGYDTAFKGITGGIFEFGFPDAILQMFAAFLYEMKEGKPLKKFAGCVTPDETAISHRLFTAALESHKKCSVVKL